MKKLSLALLFAVAVLGGADIDARDRRVPIAAVASDGANLLTNLVAFWELEEASGTRVDAHSDNDLTDNNTVTQAAGKVGNASHHVAASSEYLTHANNAALTAGDIDATYCVWVKATTLSGLPSITSKWDPEFEFFLRYAASGPFFEFQLWSGATPVVNVAASNFGAASTGVWYFVCGWFDATADTGYISVNNGTANSAAQTGTPTTTGYATFFIGFSWDGEVDQAGMWKRVLTAAERTWLYNSGAGRAYSELGS